MTVASDTVTVSREDLIEAVAMVWAASDLFLFCDSMVSAEDKQEALCHMAAGLRARLLGPPPDPDVSVDAYEDAYDSDPTEVELQARVRELEADMIDASLERVVNNAVSHARYVKERERPAQSRMYARMAREQGHAWPGTFPTTQDVLDEIVTKQESACEA